MVTVSISKYKLGKPTVYSVVVANESKHLELWKRYTEFEDLARAIEAETGQQLPVALPVKQWWHRNDDDFCNARRIELETVLRAAVMDQSIVETMAMRDFLQLTQLNKNEGTSAADWTKASVQLTSLISSARSATSAKRRIALLEAASLATKLTELLTSLAQKPNRGFGAGELRRRQMQAEDAVRTIQQLNVVPASGEINSQMEKPRPGGGRVLGETDTTRKLNNTELMQQQQTQMQQQESTLNELLTTIGRQKQLGMAINDELSRQNEMLEELDSDLHNVNNRLNEAKRKTTQFL